MTHYTGANRAFAGSYSPDGNWILFRLEEGGIHQEADYGVQTLYRISPDGHGLHAILGPGTFRPRSFDWVPRRTEAPTASVSRPPARGSRRPTHLLTAGHG